MTETDTKEAWEGLIAEARTVTDGRPVFTSPQAAMRAVEGRNALIDRLATALSIAASPPVLQFVEALVDELPAMSMEWSDEVRGAWFECLLTLTGIVRRSTPVTDDDRAWATATARTLFGEDGKEDSNDLAAVAERAMRRADKAEAALSLPPAQAPITHEMIEAGISSLGADDDRSAGEVAIDCYLAMSGALGRALNLGPPKSSQPMTDIAEFVALLSAVPSPGGEK